MQLINSLSRVEYFFIVLFGIAYLLYLFRSYRVSKTLHLSLGIILFKMVLRTVYFTLFLIAMMGPSFGNNVKEVKSIGKDIFICVDLSGSMNASDIQPSRLEKVKFELKKIVNAFNSDRVGMIIFSSEAFVQCPLTYDQSALNLFIESLSTGLVPNAGTDFGPPLRIALDKLLKETETNGINQKSKIIMLISDGEDHGEMANDVVERIENKGVRLYTLGVGTKTGGQIPTKNGFKLNKSGKVVTTKLDSDEMKRLAQQTNGSYFEINQKRNEVSKMINIISGIKGDLRDTRQIDANANKYFYFLLLAFLLMLVDFLFNLKAVRL